MSEKIFKISFYCLLIFLITFVFLKDVNIFKNDFYENISIITKPDNVLVLVNKNNKLDEFYKPSDLSLVSVKFSNEDKYLRLEAKEAFEKLSFDASKEGFSITAVSGFRDYTYQKKLYEYYQGQKSDPDKVSARPGHSEHQTGLAVDVQGSNSNYNLFSNTKEFKWMKNNAHKYGFILRYPKNKEKITGFKYEPWHYRYVGIDNATVIYEKKITLEEYLK